MANKKTATATEDVDPVVTHSPITDLVRIEESVEDFIKTRLPHVGKASLEINYLFSDRSGGKFYRCNFWKVMESGFIPLNKIVQSHYVRIDSVNGSKVFNDLTKVR